MSTESHIEYIRLDALHSAERNAKLHNIPAIQASLSRFGFVTPVAMNEATERLVAGHGRVEAANALMRAGKAPPARVRVEDDGMWSIPVLRGISFDAVDARAYLLADNRLTEIGGWDSTALLEELAELQALDDALVGVGWTDTELASMLDEQKKFEIGKQAITSDTETERFLNASVKQITLFYDADVYDNVVQRLDALMERCKLETYSEMLVALLDAAEGKQPAQHLDEVASEA